MAVLTAPAAPSLPQAAGPSCTLQRVAPQGAHGRPHRKVRMADQHRKVRMADRTARCAWQTSTARCAEPSSAGTGPSESKGELVSPGLTLRSCRYPSE
jgi:hypothetical protein